MGSLRVTLCTGVLAAAVLTPTAYAADGGGVLVTPAAPAPGTDVTLRVSGCTERTAVAASAALVADVTLTGTDGTLVGESRVRSTLTAGAYAVKVTCGGTDRTGTLTVAHPRGTPAAHASPVAPVDAGGGGTADLAAVDARETGPGTGQAVTGLALMGVAALVVARARRRRETS
ncbi:hypothetical protein AB0K80_07860 [Streptomyces sp. NPDC052682]|uniref:hypothetical protein n=1 Tax=Streptomyces sp. NPDC052682 TaxID=3154954 RepID=UPI0034272E5A